MAKRKTKYEPHKSLWCVTAECPAPEDVNSGAHTTPEPHWFNAEFPEPEIKAWLKTLNVKVRGVSLFISRHNPNSNLPTNWGLPPTPENNYSQMLRHYRVNSRGALRDDTSVKPLTPRNLSARQPEA